MILNYLISGWNIDPCDRQVIGPRLMGIDSYKIKPELDFIIHFLPLDFIKTEVIHSTNRYSSKHNPRWSDINLNPACIRDYLVHGSDRNPWSLTSLLGDERK